MSKIQNNTCVIIASHISNQYRIPYLKDCLLSLVNQTISPSIHLSISFETEEYRNIVIKTLHDTPDLYNYGELFIYVREQKTTQMQHIELLCNEISIHNYDWIMFCDDDDTYEPMRVERFHHYISKQIENSTIDKCQIGLYESTFGKNHREHRHEYWCYCISFKILKQFFDRLNNATTNTDIINHTCCDIMFANYLRRLNDDYLFIAINENLYNYHIHEDSNSITGHIQKTQSTVRCPNPPDIGDITFADYIVDWNTYLYDNLHLYLHDTYLRTIVGTNFDDILKAEFKADYPHIKFIDECHIKQLKELYEYLCDVCNKVYDIGL